MTTDVRTDLVGPVFDDVVSTLPGPQSNALAAALLRGGNGHPIELRAVAMAVGPLVSTVQLTPGS